MVFDTDLPWLHNGNRIMFELTVLCTGASIIMAFDTDLPLLHKGNHSMFELAVLCTAASIIMVHNCR